MLIIQPSFKSKESVIEVTKAFDWFLVFSGLRLDNRIIKWPVFCL